MNTTASESLIEVLVERFEKHQLERILRLKQQVVDGGLFSEYDRDFLDGVCREAMESKYLVDKFPQYQPLFAQVVHLYREITTMALKNEQEQAHAGGG